MIIIRQAEGHKACESANLKKQSSKPFLSFASFLSFTREVAEHFSQGIEVSKNVGRCRQNATLTVKLLPAS